MQVSSETIQMQVHENNKKLYVQKYDNKRDRHPMVLILCQTTYLYCSTLNVFQQILRYCSNNYACLFLYPNDIILDVSKFKALAYDKIIAIQKLKFRLGKVENIVGKGENAGFQHFLLFQLCFQKLSFPEVIEVGIVRADDN